MKKTLLSLSLFFLVYSPTIFAETCPTVDAIKAKQTKDWKAYDSDDDKRLSLSRELQFIQLTEAFVLAEWKKTKHGSAIHCYYRNKSGGSMEAYLAKNNFEPIKQNAWYEVTGAMHCAASMEQCKFEQVILPQKQLAARD